MTLSRIFFILFFLDITAGLVKRAYQRWLLQLVCWFSTPEVSSLPGYSCQSVGNLRVEEFKTIDFRVEEGWLSWAEIKFIDQNQKVKVQYQIYEYGSESDAEIKLETVELFSGKLAPLGTFGNRDQQGIILSAEDKTSLNTAPAITLGKIVDNPGKLPLKPYKLERDWTVIFRELEVPLPDIELTIVSETTSMRGTYLETGERFAGRPIYQCDDRFLVWDILEKRWIISDRILPKQTGIKPYPKVLAYNSKLSFSADLLDGPWFLARGWSDDYLEVYDAKVRALPAKALRQKLFYPGTATVFNNQTYVLNNGVTMPRLGLGTGGLTHHSTVLEWGVKVGYRLIDIGPNDDFAYANQKIIGKVLAQPGAPPRSDLFLTLKIGSHGYHNAIQAVSQAMMNIGTDFFDLVLIHQKSCLWECNPWQDTWRAMEHLYRKGRARSLGVAFDYHTVLQLMEIKSEDVPLSVVRTSLSHQTLSGQLGTEFEMQFVKFLQDVDCHVQIYSPFGGKKKKKLLELVGGADSVIQYILEKGMSLIMRSSDLNHIITNFHQS